MIGAEHDHQIGDHRRFALVVELDHVALAELGQRQFHHADGAFNDQLAGFENGLGLLAAQHRAGDFGRISEVGDAGIIDGEAGNADALLQFGPEDFGNVIARGAQGRLIAFGMIVGEFRRHDAQTGFDLDVGEIGIAVDVEHGTGGIVHPPDHIGGDLDRIAAVVVHLELFAGDVAGAHRDDLAADPERHPAQALAAVGRKILAEQREHRRRVRLQRVEARRHKNGRDQGHGAERCFQHEQCDRHDQQNECDQYQRPTVGAAAALLDGSLDCVCHGTAL